MVLVAPHFHVVLCLDVRTLVCILALSLPLLGTFFSISSRLASLVHSLLPFAERASIIASTVIVLGFFPSLFH